MSWEWSVECAKKPPIIPNRFHSYLYMFTYHLRSIRVFKFLSSCLQIGKAYMTALVLSSTDDRLLRQYALQLTEKRSSPVLCNSGQKKIFDLVAKKIFEVGPLVLQVLNPRQVKQVKILDGNRLLRAGISIPRESGTGHTTCCCKSFMHDCVSDCEVDILLNCVSPLQTVSL